MTMEWLDLKELKAGEDSFITVNPMTGSRRIYINSLASTLLGDETRWIKVGVDYDEKKIGFKPLRRRMPEALGLTKGSVDNDKNTRMLVNSRLIELIVDMTDIEDTTRFQAKWIEEGEYLEVDLTRKANSRFSDRMNDFSETAYNS